MDSYRLHLNRFNLYANVFLCDVSRCLFQNIKLLGYIQGRAAVINMCNIMCSSTGIIVFQNTHK